MKISTRFRLDRLAFFAVERKKKNISVENQSNPVKAASVVLLIFPSFFFVIFARFSSALQVYRPSHSAPQFSRVHHSDALAPVLFLWKGGVAIFVLLTRRVQVTEMGPGQK